MFVNWFVTSSRKYPQRPAVEVNNVQMTYKDLALLASKIAKVIQKQNIENSPIGLLTYRSFISYGGVLGIMYSKNIYLPLNPYFPMIRTRKMIQLVNCKVLIVDHACMEYFFKLLPDLQEPMIIIFPDLKEVNGISSDIKHHFILPKRTTQPALPKGCVTLMYFRKETLWLKIQTTTCTRNL